MFYLTAKKKKTQSKSNNNGTEDTYHFYMREENSLGKIQPTYWVKFISLNGFGTL